MHVTDISVDCMIAIKATKNVSFFDPTKLLSKRRFGSFTASNITEGKKSTEEL